MPVQRSAILRTALRTTLWRWVRRLLAIGLSGAALWVGYLGYCWGWWLRDNLLAQALFQCRCPAASEAVRYAPFRLVASACSDPWVRVSPSGTHLLITERAAQPPPTVLADVDTGGRTPLPFANLNTFFLTDTLLVVLRGTTGSTIVARDERSWSPRPVERYNSWNEATVQHDEAGTLYFFLDAQYVVFVPLIPESPGFVFDSAIDVRTLVRDPWVTQPERTIVITNALQQLTSTHPMWDVDGRGIVDRATQTVLVATGRRAAAWPLRPWMPPLPFQPIGWLAGGRSVIYQFGPERAFLIDFGSGAPYGRLGLIVVPQPILALDVPEELLRAIPPP